MQRSIVRLAAIAFIFASAPATGQNLASKWKECQDANYSNADNRIAACTAIIESGQQTPQNLAVAYGNRGNGYSDKGKFNLAIADYSRYLQTIPSGAGYYSRARVQNIKRNYDEAIADATRAIDLNEPKALSLRCSAYGGKAFEEEKKDSARAALADYKKAITDCRNAPWDTAKAMADGLARAGIVRLGGKQVDKGDYKEAIAILDEVAELLPDDPEVHHQRGRAYKYSGDQARAGDNFERAIAMLEAKSPKSEYDYLSEGEVYFSKGDYERAEGAYGAAIGIKPDSFFALGERCKVRAVLGRLEESLSDCNAAIAKSNQTAKGTRGIPYLKMKNYDAALADFDVLLQKNAKLALPLYGRGLAKLAKGDETGAREDMENAQKLNAHIAADFDSWGMTRDLFEAGGLWRTVKTTASAIASRVRGALASLSGALDHPAQDEHRPTESDQAKKANPSDAAIHPVAPSAASASVIKRGPGPADSEADGIAAYNRREYAAALSRLRPLAEHGNATAQFYLAMLYDDGNGVAQDSAEAVSWFRKAAEQGDPGAQYRLGQHYATGNGVQKDYGKARTWYEWAAARHHPDAEFRLGTLLVGGNAADQARAKDLFRAAAEDGQVSAQVLIGDFAEDAKNHEEAVQWWRKAAAQGNAQARERLGMQ